MKKLSFLIMSFLSMFTYGQNTSRQFAKNYEVFPEVIVSYPKDSLFKQGKYEECIKKYFSSPDTLRKAKDVYCVAACYDKLNMPDSTMRYLSIFMEKSLDDRAILYLDDFSNLKSDSEKWGKIIEQLEQLYLNEIKNAENKELALQIFYLAVDRYKMGMPYSNLSIQEIDSLIKTGVLALNYIPQYVKDMDAIIEKYGFPTIQMVGKYASFQSYDILHHSHSLIKYYPKVRTAFESGGVDTGLFVMMTDRYLNQKGKKQLYGTQLQGGGTKYHKKYPGRYILSPVKDFKNVNKRRAAMGLNTVEEYVESFIGEYDAIIPEEYYKKNKR